MVCYNSTENDYIKNQLGDYDSLTYMIEISKCNSNVRQCHPDIDSIMDGFYAVIYYVNQYPNPRNYSQPLTSSFESITQLLAKGFTKYHYFKFAGNQFYSDNGWLSEEVIVTDYNSFFSLTSDINTSTKSLFNNRVVLYSIILEATKVTKLTIRTYMKLSDVFAKIGGLVTIVFYLLRIFLSSYCNYIYTYYVKGVCAEFSRTNNFKELNAKHNLFSNIAPIINKNNEQAIDLNEHTIHPHIQNNLSSVSIVNQESTEDKVKESEHFLKYIISTVACCLFKKTYNKYKLDMSNARSKFEIRTYLGIVRMLSCDP